MREVYKAIAYMLIGHLLTLAVPLTVMAWSVYDAG